MRNRIELRLLIVREIRASRHVLAKQSIRVFVGAALPRTLWIAEIDWTPVAMEKLRWAASSCRGPRSGTPLARGQTADSSRQRLHHVSGLFAPQPNQEHVARGPLHQCRDIGIRRPRQQIAFPMPGDPTVLDLAGRSRIDTASTMQPPGARPRASGVGRCAAGAGAPPAPSSARRGSVQRG